MQKRKTVHTGLPALVMAAAMLLPALSGCSVVEGSPDGSGPVTALPMEMAVKITDLDGDGWEWIAGLPVPEYGAEYAHQVEFVRRADTPDGKERVFCKTAVYSTEDAARSAFQSAREGSALPHSHDLGDEAFLDTSPVINGTGLVFRKANVVVWMGVNHEYRGDILELGGIVEERISQNM